ncbi:MAG TPA: glycosyltransferase [Stellaceae bacterium]|nr:glycosyltransferase [Stellaceae bacterium]
MFQPPIHSLDLEAKTQPQLDPSHALRVGVLVDLPFGPHSGGHVKCWTRLAEAAMRRAGDLDLTVYFTGSEPRQIAIADNVRYEIVPSVFSTARVGFLSHVPDHTDLAPWHPRIAAALRGFDVIHTTDGYFAYARTALRVARRRRIPLVNSVHTNTPEYARVFTGQTIDKLFGHGLLAHVLRSRLELPEFVERRMLRRLDRYHRACDFVLVSRPSQLEPVSSVIPGRVALLRRGIEHQRFCPKNRNRGWLATEFGIAPDKTVVLYVGRLNHGKNVGLVVDAVASLVERGFPVHLLCAGDGDQRAAILARLGPYASCPGNLEPDTLAAIYASSDLFAFPSEIEEYANVVLEALASGLPVMVSARSSMGRLLIENVTGFVLPGEDAGRWADAIAALVTDPALRRDMSHAARSYAERRLPSWDDVLSSDLLPHWREVVERRRHSA